MWLDFLWLIEIRSSSMTDLSSVISDWSVADMEDVFDEAFEMTSSVVGLRGQTTTLGGPVCHGIGVDKDAKSSFVQVVGRERVVMHVGFVVA
jgi:hypothetical protein